jgi:hypothetical protein
MEEQIIYSRFRRACVAALALLTLTAPHAVAQSATGSIRGVVVAEDGTAIARARVTARNTATDAERQVVADAAGRFDAPGLPPGQYEVTAEAPGLAARRQEALQLHIGETVSLRFELRQALTDTLTITDIPPPIEPSHAAIDGWVSAEVMAALPSPTRNALDVVTLTPGPTRDVYSGGFSFNGQPPVLNNVVVDGGDTRFPFFGRPFQYSQDAIQGLVVKTNSYSAEYGRATGGVIGVATRSGGNRYSGSAFGYARNGQFGGTLGGPIVADRHFFFASYEGQRYDETLDDGFAWQRDHDTVLARTDHALTGSQRLTLRYNAHDFRGTELETDARSFVGVYSGAFGRNVVNEARFQGARDRDLAPGFEPMRRVQGANTLMIATGAHTLKAGIDLLREEFADFDFETSNLALFAQDEWRVTSALTASAGIRHDRQSFSDNDLFGEDTARTAPRLSLAWSPVGSRYVVRGGYGWFYGRRFESVIAPPLDEEPRAEQASVGVDYDWMRHTSIAASYLFAAGNEPLGDSRYHGLTVDLHRRFAQQYHYRFAYTLGRVDHDPLAGLNDVRHRVTAAAVYETTLFAERFGGVVEDILENWNVSVIWTLQSGQPALDLAGGFTGERRLPRQASLSPRLARHFGLGGTREVSLFGEAFNLTDNQNYLTNGALAQGRVMQLGARFSF